jgi:hypothetical protein
MVMMTPVHPVGAVAGDHKKPRTTIPGVDHVPRTR